MEKRFCTSTPIVPHNNNSNMGTLKFTQCTLNAIAARLAQESEPRVVRCGAVRCACVQLSSTVPRLDDMTADGSSLLSASPTRPASCRDTGGLRVAGLCAAARLQAVECEEAGGQGAPSGGPLQSCHTLCARHAHTHSRMHAGDRRL